MLYDESVGRIIAGHFTADFAHCLFRDADEHRCGPTCISPDISRMMDLLQGDRVWKLC